MTCSASMRRRVATDSASDRVTSLRSERKYNMIYSAWSVTAAAPSSGLIRPSRTALAVSTTNFTRSPGFTVRQPRAAGEPAPAQDPDQSAEHGRPGGDGGAHHHGSSTPAPTPHHLLIIGASAAELMNEV